MEEIIAVSKARGLLKDLQIDHYPVDATAIANALGFRIRNSHKLGPAEAGQLVKVGVQQFIVVNADDSPVRQRFTILHEIAHEVLGLPSVHGNTILDSELESYAGRPKEEILCDVFAAECLVPWHFLLPIADELPYDVATICKLSDDFQASRSCVASRFAQISRNLHLFVLAENGVIRNVVRSLAVRENQYWISIGTRVPRLSAAAATRTNDSDKAATSLDGTIWSASNCATRFFCEEEAIALKRWEQTLSLLTLRKSAIRFLIGDEILTPMTNCWMSLLVNCRGHDANLLTMV